MQKHKARIFGVILVLLMVFGILFVPNIYAEETPETQQMLNCAELADKYGIYIKSTGVDKQYVIVKDIPTCSDPEANHASAEFQIVNINNIAVANGGILNSKNKEVKFEAGLLTEGRNHYLTVVLKNTDPATEGLAYQYLTVRYDETVEPKGSSGVNLVANTNYAGICSTYRNEAASLGADGLSFYKQSIPDCWQQYVIFNYSQTELQEKIDNIRNLWKAYNDQSALNSPDFLTEFNRVKGNAEKGGNVISNPSSKTLCLNCNYEFVKTGTGAIKEYTNTKYGEKVSSTEYYLNKDYYYHKAPTEIDTLKYTYNYAVGNTVVKEHNACKTTCEESVKVEYGPPVASKAGLCFEYKVKVTSYVKCNAEFVAPQPEQPSSACTPAPKCVSLSGTERYKPQAGPTDEFDTCVQSCDGGKYTEKCSLKCYKQVYGELPIKLALDYETAYAQRLADNSSYSIAKCLKDNTGYYGCYGRSTSKINWYALINYQNEAGEIDESKPVIHYNSKLGLGRWYLDRSKKGSNYNTGGYDISGIKDTCSSGFCGSYVADDNGFYRANHGGSLCTDNCIWQMSSCGANEYLNPGSIAADYKANKKIYDDHAQTCVASTKCETHQATFTISLKYDTADKNDTTTVQRVDFPFTSNSASIVNDMDKEPATKAVLTPTEKHNDSIIISKDGCYANKSSGKIYMSEWGFPGTYIHNKTGEISYINPETEGWYYDANKFCMPLDAESVNVKWWEWYKLGNHCYSSTAIKEELEPNSCNQSATAAEKAKKSSNGYNIIAQTRAFGKYQWNFDVKCFYALRNEICDITADKCCGSSTKETNGTMNYTFRTIDNENMFPNAKDINVIDQTKRDIGFNWTDKAKTLKNEHYIIDPVTLREQIKQKAQTLYTDSDNLDYQFYLTPSALAKIRSYNNNSDYASWEGSIEEVNGLKVYLSNLFRQDVTGTKVLSNVEGSVIKIGVPGVNNQINNVGGAS